jgi:hypothetical protein
MPYSPSRLAEAVKSTIEKMEETMPGDPTVAKLKRRVILLLSEKLQSNRHLNMLLVARPQTECDWHRFRQGSFSDQRGSAEKLNYLALNRLPLRRAERLLVLK